MDNVTHTLTSVMVGLALHRSTYRSSNLSEKAHRAVVVTVVAVGGNLPDADVIYTSIAGGKLDYLLHHRGHTHTLIGALVLALLLFVAVRLWWRYRGVEPSAADVRVLAGAALLGPFLHLGLDLTNSYGIHPFWPADDRWYYGDAVFIIEPLLWAGCAPLLFLLRSWWARALVALVLLVGVGLCWASGLVPAPFAALVTLLTVGLAALARLASPRAALTGGIAAWLGVTALFVVTSRAADARIDTLLADTFPAERTLDTVLTPHPANPACHQVLMVALVGDRYVVRSGVHALVPALVPAADCARRSLPGTPTPRSSPWTGHRPTPWCGPASCPYRAPCPRPSRRTTAP